MNSEAEKRIGCITGGSKLSDGGKKSTSATVATTEGEIYALRATLNAMDLDTSNEMKGMYLL